MPTKFNLIIRHVILYKILILSFLFTSSLFAEHFISHGQTVTLTKLAAAPLRQSRSVKTSVDYYKTDSGKQLGVDNKLIISFEDLSIQHYIEKEFSLSLIKKLNPHMFVYKVTNRSKTLSLANSLSLIEGVAFCHPDFIIKKKNRTNDPLFSQTWHLGDNRGINALEAWNYTKGRGIIIGLYDEGIDLTHEDLRDNIIGYGNFNNADGQIDMLSDGVRLSNSLHNAPASVSDEWHGTSCAGLMIAKGDNQRGSVGVAPEAKLLALRYANSNISRDIEAFYEMDKKGAAIISNSWGTYSMFDTFNSALKDLSINGRNGKGLLIFFAAGNDGCNMDEYYRISPDGTTQCLAKPDNATQINDESESPYVISIAASTQYNRIANYSNYGSSIDFTAPGSQYPAAIVTTDATGRLGRNSSNYTTSFSGTSAAAPIAAASAALVLAENPTLSREEVIDILRYTAKKLGDFAYDFKGRNDHWGYGLIDAGEAVKLASIYGKANSENFAHKIYQDLHK